MLKNLLAKPIESNLNGAVHSELFASHLYKHLATKLQRLGFFGAQKHFLSESADELEHYQKIADFMNDRGAIAAMPQIEAMDETVTTLRDAIEIAFETELQLEKDYTRWYRAAMSEDPITAQFLLGFLEIQRKSVGEYGDLLARLDRAGKNEAAILIIDKELGE
ncbi:MAG TPA: ferritin-like domain-containing protein [Noviherbaspirillum sp.]|nr:ferritin-like domain-containing protein [Noviherbaspirillum sp.]